MISMKKQYRTRDGRNATILTTTRKGSNYPVVALIDGSDGETLKVYTAEGRISAGLDTVDDLIEVAQKRQTFLVLSLEGGVLDYENNESEARGLCHLGNQHLLRVTYCVQTGEAEASFVEERNTSPD